MRLFVPVSGQGSQFDTVGPAPATAEKPTSHGRVCVYTCCFGQYDYLPPILSPTSHVDFLYFSDADFNSRQWARKKCELIFSDPKLSANYYKILPHKTLSDYDASIYIDANTLLFGNIDRFIQRWLTNHAFVAWRHPRRQDLYQEAEAILAQFRHAPEPVIEQIESYRAEGMGNGTGLVENSFLWRRHREPHLNRFMDDWWAEVSKFSKRDQLAQDFA